MHHFSSASFCQTKFRLVTSLSDFILTFSLLLKWFISWSRLCFACQSLI